GERLVKEKREEYSEDMDILHLASELVVDAVIEPDDLRAELISRYALVARKDRRFAERRNPVTPAGTRPALRKRHQRLPVGIPAPQPESPHAPPPACDPP